MIFSKPKKSNPDPLKKTLHQNPKILEVNLIKGEAHIVFDWRKNLSVTVIVFIIAAAFIAEIYFGLDMWAKEEGIRSQALADKVSAISQEIKDTQIKADEALAFKNKSGEVSRLLNEHIYWSNFFDWLEKNTLSTVEFAGFSGSINGVYRLEATASRFQDVSWQIKVLSEDPLVKSVSVSQVSTSEEEISTSLNNQPGSQKRVSFSLSLAVDPAIFRK